MAPLIPRTSSQWLALATIIVGIAIAIVVGCSAHSCVTNPVGSDTHSVGYAPTI
jgi:hypothetical protein